MTVRVLVTGAGGMLGRDVVAAAPSAAEVVGLTRAQLDIGDAAAVAAALRSARPQAVINCAAWTQVDRAEAEPDAAMRANVQAAGVLGRAAREAGAFILHLSTDYVFDGGGRTPWAEGDPTRPLGTYGRSKLEGERALAASGARALIVRTQWLFGGHGRSFPRTMWERARAGQPSRVVNDQWGRPTFTADLAGALWRLVGDAAAGRQLPAVLHVANGGITNWYEVARAAYEAAGASAGLLSPCTTAEYPTPAPRPLYSALATERYRSLTGQELPPWEDALRRFFHSLQNQTMNRGPSSR